MSIMAYNGGAVVAMVGKDCVAIATDKRFGVQAMTVGTNFPKVFKVHSKLFYGLAGLISDVETLSEKFRFSTNMYELKETRKIAPQTFAHLVSSTLYEKRFGPYYAEPIVAGLDEKTGEPFICSMDLIGCINFAKDFVVVGTANNQLYGMCESLWQPDLEPDELFETISQSLLNAMDRDAISGWGATVYIISKDQLTIKELKARQD